MALTKAEINDIVGFDLAKAVKRKAKGEKLPTSHILMAFWYAYAVGEIEIEIPYPLRRKSKSNLLAITEYGDKEVFHVKLKKNGEILNPTKFLK